MKLGLSAAFAIVLYGVYSAFSALVFTYGASLAIPVIVGILAISAIFDLHISYKPLK